MASEVEWHSVENIRKRFVKISVDDKDWHQQNSDFLKKWLPLNWNNIVIINSFAIISMVFQTEWPMIRPAVAVIADSEKILNTALL